MPLTLFRRGETWHYRGTVAGRRLRGSTETSQKERAQQIAAQIEDREWKRRTDGPESILTFGQAAVLYLKAEKSARFVEELVRHWKDTPVRQITAGAVRQAAITLYPSASAATRNRQAITPTQAVVNHAASLEMCRPLRVERFPTVSREKTPATWAWIQAFRASASPHLGAMACFMFLTGARIGEAVSLRWNDVDLHGRRALIRQTKTGSERSAHLPPVLVTALGAIPSDRETGAKVFGYASRHSVKLRWAAAAKRAGIAPLTFHACRHGFATSMLHAGVDPVTVARLGGWKTPQHVFKTYGHAMSDDTLADRISDTNLTHVEGGRRKSKARSGG